MKPITHSLGGLLSASALALSLAVIAQPALAGISDSRHNLGSAAPTTNNRVTGSGGTTGGTAEICVFCHTPHGSNTTVKAPLWNKNIVNTASSYTNYNSSNSLTFDATPAGPGPVSLACLSCHDGTQAMDNIINAPGYGGNSANGGGTSGRSYTWTTGSNAITSPSADGFMGNGILNLGTDLSNDHPVGMNYAACADAQSPVTLTGCLDQDFRNADGTSTTRYFIEAGTGNGSFEKTDLPLYGGGTGINRVECATCHDPHNTDNGTFLRISNAGSTLCLTCHDK